MFSSYEIHSSHKFSLKVALYLRIAFIILNYANGLEQ